MQRTEHIISHTPEYSMGANPDCPVCFGAGDIQSGKCPRCYGHHHSESAPKKIAFDKKTAINESTHPKNVSEMPKEYLDKQSEQAKKAIKTLFGEEKHPHH